MPTNAPAMSSAAAEAIVQSLLLSCGLRLDLAWLATTSPDAIQFVSSNAIANSTTFSAAAIDQATDSVLERVLNEDLRSCSSDDKRSSRSGSRTTSSTSTTTTTLLPPLLLPLDLNSAHGSILSGPFLLQIMSCIDISACADERSTSSTNAVHDTTSSSKRCLKLDMTDGRRQRASGDGGGGHNSKSIQAFEYRPLPYLHSQFTIGSKLVVRNVEIRRGMMLLTPENCLLVGGTLPPPPSSSLLLAAQPQNSTTTTTIPGSSAAITTHIAPVTEVAVVPVRVAMPQPSFVAPSTSLASSTSSAAAAIVVPSNNARAMTSDIMTCRDIVRFLSSSSSLSATMTRGIIKHARILKVKDFVHNNADTSYSLRALLADSTTDTRKNATNSGTTIDDGGGDDDDDDDDDSLSSRGVWIDVSSSLIQHLLGGIDASTLSSQLRKEMPKATRHAAKNAVVFMEDQFLTAGGEGDEGDPEATSEDKCFQIELLQATSGGEKKVMLMSI